MKNDLNIFKMLADPTRLHILKFLLNGEKCVCEIIPCTKRTESTVSIQLHKLEKAGILSSRKEGKKVIYRIKDFRVCEMLKIMGDKTIIDLKTNCCIGTRRCRT